MVTISRDKRRSVLTGVFKSLQVRIVCLLVLFAALSCLFVKKSVFDTYEKRAITQRTVEIQNQCAILCSQMAASDFLSTADSVEIGAKLSQLSSIYNGRVVVVNDEYRIIKDTYNLQEGKTIVSEDVIKCFGGQSITNYDKENHYLEVATPIEERVSGQVGGVMLISVSTNILNDNYQALEAKAKNAIIAAVLSALALAVVVSMLVVRPFVNVRKKLSGMAEGFLEPHLNECTYSETEAISDQFNRLMDRYRILDETRDAFVANVSHELKTPLTSMKLLADSLTQSDAPVEMYREFMEDMSGEIERENKIINDLLSLVKLDKKNVPLNIQNCNINELLERVLKILKPIGDAQNIEIVFESLRTVFAEVDEVKLSLAFTNLVENAIKYNRKGGWVHVKLDADHQYFYVSVIDSGIGIPKEESDHIFERFYRVDKSHSREIGGTGLGLAIVRSAVAKHKGGVSIQSQMGEGTTFVVRIPLTYQNT